LTLVVGCVPSPPERTELVADRAALLDTDQRERIEIFHGLLRTDYDIDYRVVTSRERRDIDEHSLALFETVGAGDLSSTGRGLLLLIDPAQDLVRLEVGYALEGTYPDAFIAYVEQRQMVPFFRSRRIADGILATTELIVTRAQVATKNSGLESEVWLKGSGGAGASTTTRLGEGPDDTFIDTNSEASRGMSPTTTLLEYMEAMQNRNANPALDIYTPATRQMLRGWVMTPAQMDNIVKTYRGCDAEAERIDANSRYGVIRYPVKARQCAPWFFENIDGTWALDLTMMQRAIRFGRDNSWHFDRNAEHPYAYAFGDWSLDSRGYPQEEN
jgi:uncharacterized protein